MTPEGAAAMAKIIKTLLERSDSADFRKPVAWRSLKIYDYPQIIAKPMDLGTVKQKFERQGYKSVEQCADDIRLIWSNCKRYNGEGSDFYNLADRLSKQFEELFSKVKPETKKRGREPASAADAGQAWRAAQAKKLRKSINDVAADLVCPITQELPFDPVMAEDGKIYERNAILEWFATKPAPITSPSTNARMGTRIIPAIQTKNTISTLIKSGAIEGEVAEAWRKKLAVEKEVKECRAKAEAGDGEAMWELGGWYQSGSHGLAKDKTQARAWFERSAATRDPRGLSCFGSCLLRGVGGPPNNSLGWVYITDGAHLGSNHAAYKLGSAFYHGRFGLPKDPVQARFWLKKAVDEECKFDHLATTGDHLAAVWLRELGE